MHVLIKLKTRTMKKKVLLALCSIAYSALIATAQDANNKDCNCKNNANNNSGLALAVGGSGTYYYGPSGRNFDKFEDSRVNWQLDGMLGITVARSKSGRRTMLAAFGDYGFNNRATITQLLADQNYVSTALKQSGSNNYYQYEGGFLIAEVLRISTGLGRQNFTTQTLASTDSLRLNATHLQYYSSTVGLNINLGSIAWVLNCNFAYGKEFKHTVLTPSTGLMLRF
jgi:hypothetical protein